MKNLNLASMIGLALMSPSIFAQTAPTELRKPLGDLSCDKNLMEAYFSHAKPRICVGALKISGESIVSLTSLDAKQDRCVSDQLKAVQELENSVAGRKLLQNHEIRRIQLNYTEGSNGDVPLMENRIAGVLPDGWGFDYKGGLKGSTLLISFGQRDGKCALSAQEILAMNPAEKVNFKSPIGDALKKFNSTPRVATDTTNHHNFEKHLPYGGGFGSGTRFGGGFVGGMGGQFQPDTSAVRRPF